MAYEDLRKTLLAHYCTTPSEIVWRHKFYSRSKKLGETVETFVSGLRSISEYCDFGATLDSGGSRNLQKGLICVLSWRDFENSLILIVTS